MTMLLDTNIVSELCRRNPNAAVVAWAAEVVEFSISAITVDCRDGPVSRTNFGNP